MTQRQQNDDNRDRIPRDAAAAALLDRLNTSARLLARCEALSSRKGAHKVGALAAAARIMQADAAISATLLKLVLGETRHRSFVEQVQSAMYNPDRLNSRFSNTPSGEEVKAELVRRVHRYVDDAKDAESLDAKFLAQPTGGTWPPAMFTAAAEPGHDD